MVWNWLRRHPVLADTAVVLALGVGYVGAAVHQHRYGIGVALALLQVAPLLLCRRYPIGVLAVITAAGVLDGLVYSQTAPFAALVAVYFVATQCGRAVSLVATALSAAAFAGVALGVSGFGRALGFLILFAAAWVSGDNLGTRRAYLRELEEKADRLERERAAESARARAE